MIARQADVAADLLLDLPVPLDRLPYTPDFDRVHERFNQLVGKDLSRHEVWWCLLDARKRGRGRPTRRRRRVKCSEPSRGLD